MTMENRGVKRGCRLAPNLYGKEAEEIMARMIATDGSWEPRLGKYVDMIMQRLPAEELDVLLAEYGSEIDIRYNRRVQGCQHSDIDAKKWYLAIDAGTPFLGKFEKEWYGWNFIGGENGAGTQLDWLERVYETNLNSKHPAMRRRKQ